MALRALSRAAHGLCAGRAAATAFSAIRAPVAAANRATALATSRALVSAVSSVPELRKSDDGAWTLPVPKASAGAVIGAQGHVLRDISRLSRCGCTMAPEDGASGVGTRTVTLSGSEAGVALAAELVAQRCHPAPSRDGAAVRTEEVTIADADRGSVIGRRGLSKALIESVSGAMLTLPARVPFAVPIAVPIAVTGTDEAIAVARRLIGEHCDKTERIVAVPASAVVRVLGSGGSTIERIQSLSRANCGLPELDARGESNDMLIRLLGTPAEVEFAAELIESRVAFDAHAEGADSPLPSPDEAGHRLTQLSRGDDVVSVTVPVPGDVNVGALIGRGGESLFRLRRLTGADVAVTRARADDATAHRAVRLEGSPAQVARAERAVRLIFPVLTGLPDAPGAGARGGGGGAGAAAAALRSSRRRSASRPAVPKVVITGGAGNVGTKAAAHLVQRGCDVHVLDPWAPESPVDGVTYHEGDMLTLDGWPALFDDAWTVIHLAAINPYPGLTWAEAADSIELNFNVLLEAALRGVPRVAFASSNHVMGGWKEKGGAVVSPEFPLLSPDLPVEVGTKWAADGAWHDSVAYATAKIAGERAASSLALRYPETRFFSLRIGWCQPGANLPSQMTAGGGGRHVETLDNFERATSVYPSDSYYDEDVILEWYKKMWLSNRDWQQLAERCVFADVPEGTPRHVILNANSRNTGSRWDVTKTCEVLGYDPEDDVVRAEEEERKQRGGS